MQLSGPLPLHRQENDAFNPCVTAGARGPCTLEGSMAETRAAAPSPPHTTRPRVLPPRTAGAPREASHGRSRAMENTPCVIRCRSRLPGAQIEAGGWGGCGPMQHCNVQHRVAQGAACARLWCCRRVMGQAAKYKPRRFQRPEHHARPSSNLHANTTAWLAASKTLPLGAAWSPISDQRRRSSSQTSCSAARPACLGPCQKSQPSLGSCPACRSCRSCLQG
jgi:hypothetical protein